MFRRSCGLFPSRGIKEAMRELPQTPSGRQQQLRRRCSFHHFATLWIKHFSSWSIDQDVFREPSINQTDSFTHSETVTRVPPGGLIEFQCCWPVSSLRLACVNTDRSFGHLCTSEESRWAKLFSSLSCHIILSSNTFWRWQMRPQNPDLALRSWAPELRSERTGLVNQGSRVQIWLGSILGGRGFIYGLQWTVVAEIPQENSQGALKLHNPNTEMMNMSSLHPDWRCAEWRLCILQHAC